MCPLRVLLIFLSATLAGFFVLRNLKAQTTLYEEQAEQHKEEEGGRGGIHKVPVPFSTKEEILDETDEYVDVHNKIKINMLPTRRSSPRASGIASISQFQRRTPTASPLSPYQETSVLRSPLSQHAGVPGPAPANLGSPVKSLPSSPANRTSSGQNSPSPLRVSRKSYEKLEKNGDSNV